MFNRDFVLRPKIQVSKRKWPRLNPVIENTSKNPEIPIVHSAAECYAGRNLEQDQQENGFKLVKNGWKRPRKNDKSFLSDINSSESEEDSESENSNP